MNDIKSKLTSKVIENDQDLHIYVNLVNQTNPDKPTSVEETLILDKGTPKSATKIRTLFYKDNQPVAGSTVLQCYWQTDPNRFTMAWNGALDDQSTIEEGIRMSMEIAREAGAQKLNLWALDKHPNVLAAAKSIGFYQVQVNPESVARLEQFQFEPFKNLITDLRAQGYEFHQFTELIKTDREAWLKKYYDFDNLIMIDVPLPYEFQPIPFEDWKRDFELEEDSWPFHLFAMKGEEIAGLTMLFRSRVDPKLGYTGLTGTHRDHRRKKLATALKAINMDRAKQAGMTRLTTDNEKDNPMLDLNIQLGFKVEWNAIGHDITL